jgi:hypothetical protein
VTSAKTLLLEPSPVAELRQSYQDALALRDERLAELEQVKAQIESLGDQRIRFSIANDQNNNNPFVLGHEAEAQRWNEATNDPSLRVHSDEAYFAQMQSYDAEISSLNRRRNELQREVQTLNPHVWDMQRELAEYDEVAEGETFEFYEAKEQSVRKALDDLIGKREAIADQRRAALDALDHKALLKLKDEDTDLNRQIMLQTIELKKVQRASYAAQELQARVQYIHAEQAVAQAEVRFQAAKQDLAEAKALEQDLARQKANYSKAKDSAEREATNLTGQLMEMMQ